MNTQRAETLRHRRTKRRGKNDLCYVRLFQELKQQNYEIHLFFLWLQDVEISFQRVAHRVALGGYNIPDKVIRRRFGLGIRNFFSIYRALLDTWQVYDNSEQKPRLIAEEIYGEIKVTDAVLFSNISSLEIEK